MSTAWKTVVHFVEVENEDGEKVQVPRRKLTKIVSSIYSPRRNTPKVARRVRPAPTPAASPNLESMVQKRLADCSGLHEFGQNFLKNWREDTVIG